MTPGHATPQGTARYRDRFPALSKADFFRNPPVEPLWLASLGLGTYLGDTDASADEEYTAAITAALAVGVNVLDTAINYRHQRSERNIGSALAKLFAAEKLQRDEVFVSTKAGYLTFDGNLPADPRAYLLKEYVEPGLIDPNQLVAGMHCMGAAFLANQIDRSRRNLGLETIDLFYLHNPETQLGEISRDAFRDRVREAFTLLEQKEREGQLRYYGMATWNGFRQPPHARDYLDLTALTEIAREVAGEQHHFRFIQLPFNLLMTEAATATNQCGGKSSLLETAADLGIGVFGSATLMQGRLAAGLPSQLIAKLKSRDDVEAAIQFARSAPGILTNLVGMGHHEHVERNLRAVAKPPIAANEWSQLLPAGS
jgi:aryl-alcohol dehydrogenase-like predicted oxidoreductase